ncbi:TPA: restriction endonuclease subunit S [Pseudomonas aeruginosa]
MSELPKGWQFVSLGEIGYVQSGVGFPNEHQGLTSGDYPVYKVGDVSRSVTQNNGKLQSANNYVSNEIAELLKGQIFEAGSTLFAKIGEALKLNRRGFVIKPGLADNNVMGYKSQQGINDRFIYYFLRTQDFAEYSRSTTVPSIRKGDIEEIKIGLPPTAEQTRIAQKLDELLAQVDTLKARIDAIPALLKRFRQSVLAAAVSGRLTEDWRVQHSLAEWRVSTFGDEGAVSGGLTKNAKRSELTLEKPYLRVANVHANKLSLGDITHIGLTDKEFEKTRLIAGDILIVEGNGSLEHIGRAAIWNDEIPDCCHQNHLIRWRPIDGMQPKFALYQLLSPQGRKQLVEVAKSTTGLHTLSITKVSALALPVPEEDEQIEIVRRVEQLFAFANQLEAKVASAKSRIDHLTQSILAKAFRGELVPQEPNDEPASVLLERIKAQRAAAPKAKRGRKASA